MSGKVVIFSAPSGAGKTTIAKEILNRITNLEFSVSACSRAMRKGERQGKDYYFLTVEDFKQKIENNEFLEWQEVYPGNFYGTLNSEMERIWNDGKNVMFDVDTFGGINIKNIYKDKALAIFIKTPTTDTLRQRLISRGTETDDSLKKRMEKAEIELSLSAKFDKVIINDDLNKAIEEAYTTITDFLNK
jgi:guanylate kinase